MGTTAITPKTTTTATATPATTTPATTTSTTPLTTTTATTTTTITTTHPVDCNQACIGMEQWDIVSMGCCLYYYCYCNGDGDGDRTDCTVPDTSVCGDTLDPASGKPC